MALKVVLIRTDLKVFAKRNKQFECIRCGWIVPEVSVLCFLSLFYCGDTSLRSKAHCPISRSKFYTRRSFHGIVLIVRIQQTKKEAIQFYVFCTEEFLSDAWILLPFNSVIAEGQKHYQASLWTWACIPRLCSLLPIT